MWHQQYAAGDLSSQDYMLPETDLQSCNKLPLLRLTYMHINVSANDIDVLLRRYVPATSC